MRARVISELVVTQEGLTAAYDAVAGCQVSNPPQINRTACTKINLPSWFRALERTESKVLLDMLDCMTSLLKRPGAEGTDALVDGGFPGAEGPDQFSRNGALLLQPLLGIEDRLEGGEELHVDGLEELPLYYERVFGVDCIHFWLFNMLVIAKS